MLKFYKALNFTANEVHGHEIQEFPENSIFQENANIFVDWKDEVKDISNGRTGCLL